VQSTGALGAWLFQVTAPSVQAEVARHACMSKVPGAFSVCCRLRTAFTTAIESGSDEMSNRKTLRLV
jgi:hypothetical protein